VGGSTGILGARPEQLELAREGSTSAPGGACASTAELEALPPGARLERAMGLEPTTFSLGSWNGDGKARWTLAVSLRLDATSPDMRGQAWTPGVARTPAEGSDRGSGDGASGWRSTHLWAVGVAMGQYGE